jgi:DNA-binding CsgD family transcriptional regulator
VSVSRASAETPSQRLLRGAKDSGFPLHQFHPPSCLDYHFGEVAYIGSLILWRSIEKPPISEETLAMVEGLRPFMLFAFSDLVARHRSEQPVHAALNRALETLAARARLSDQEQRIVMLQFMGHSYKEMADILSVTVDTVKKHFRQVHKKTGTRSQSELFAKYFTYRLD